ncbi:MAG: hypothetical protein WCK27_01755 [Verrucomicrobiota bacterium]
MKSTIFQLAQSLVPVANAFALSRHLPVRMGAFRVIDSSQQVKALGEKLELEKQKGRNGKRGPLDFCFLLSHFLLSFSSSRLPAFAVTPLRPATIFIPPEILCSVFGFGGSYKVNEL